MRHARLRRSAAAATAMTVFLGIAAAACGDSAPRATAPAATGNAAVTTPPARRDLPATPAESEAVRRLRALEASFKGRIGAYALDTGTGKTVSHRAHERFPLLSTVKAFAVAAVLHKARTADPGLLDRAVRWTAREVKPYSPMTSEHVADGLTVARLCQAAVTLSDNTAGNMLLRQIGGPEGLTRYFRMLDDPVSRLDRWETELNAWRPGQQRDTTTPAAAARDLYQIALGDALGERDRARLIGWLRANTTGDARIRAGLPKTWIVGDKTGTGEAYGTANDIAIIWPDDGAAPIVMAIYTNRRAAAAPRDEKVLAEAAAILARGLGRLR